MDFTPEQLTSQLKKTIIGQDQYIQDIATAVWMHSLRYRRFLDTGKAVNHPKTNILCLGESGTGKTLAVQTLAKLLDLPIVIEDASALRGSGWKGTSVSSVIVHALDAAGGDDARARHAVIVLDEIDKIFHSQAADPNFYPVNNLLTLIGGSVVTHSDSRMACSLDTSSMLFICLGAFSGLEEIIHKRLSGKATIGFGASGYTETPREDLFRQATKEDLHEYGMPWEFLGRIPLVTSTNALTTADYKRILTDSLASPIQQYDDLLFNSLGVHVSISDTAAEHIAQQASVSKMGARGLSQIVTELLAPAVYGIGNDDRLSRITLDMGQDGLSISYQKGSRPMPSPREHTNSRGNRPGLLTEIDIDILQSVPFSCPDDKDSIIKYSLNILDASENVRWRPISLIHPRPLLSAATCILTAAICTQLLDTDSQNPTMYNLFGAADRISPAMAAYDTNSHHLGLIRQEFITKALENSASFAKALEITKYIIKQYAHRYAYEAKYNKS